MLFKWLFNLQFQLYQQPLKFPVKVTNQTSWAGSIQKPNVWLVTLQTKSELIELAKFDGVLSVQSWVHITS